MFIAKHLFISLHSSVISNYDNYTVNDPKVYWVNSILKFNHYKSTKFSISSDFITFIHLFFFRGGQWETTIVCDKGYFVIEKISHTDALDLELTWRNSTCDFKLCLLPTNSYVQPWTITAMDQEGRRDRPVEINQSLKYYTYQRSWELGKLT